MNNVNKVNAQIINALFRLLNNNENEVTVVQLIKEANVSRASFYRNFNTIEDVISVFIKELLFPGNIELANYFEAKEWIYKILLNIHKERERFILIEKHGNLHLLNKIFDDELVAKILSMKVRYSQSEKFTITANICSLIRYWISCDFSIEINDILDQILKAINLSYPSTLPLKSEHVFFGSEMRLMDKACIESDTPSLELMYRAGKSIFENVQWYGKIGIVCGKGNNAGDGYVLATLLKKSGYDVTLLLTSDKFSNDGKYYFEKCLDEKVNYINIDESYKFEGFDILVDALLGTGINSDIKEPLFSIIKNINETNAYIVSIDINSGLSADNGLCNIAVKSDITLSIGSLKTGLYLNKAKDYVGSIKNLDIGIPEFDNYSLLIGNEEIQKTLQIRHQFSNKGDFGYIALIGGSSLYSGAIRMSTLANLAMKSGAGVVLLAVPNCLQEMLQHEILESTIYPLDSENGFISYNEEQLNYLIKRCSTIAFGMGLGNGKDNEKILTHLLNNFTGTLLIDADGLNTLSKLDLTLLKRTKAQVVLTPHVKEMSRLTKISIDEIFQNPINISKDFATRNNCIVLLKGTTTIITDGKTTYLSNRGCAGMATAGSGDVLSGILSSLLASNKENLLLATAAGAYINGLAGEIAEHEHSDITMIASDTIKAIKNII